MPKSASCRKALLCSNKHKEVLNSLSHQGNANPNFTEIPSYPSEHQENEQQILVRMWGKGTLIHCWWECKLVQPLWKSVWRFLKKLKIELPWDSTVPLLGIFPKECKSAHNRDSCTPMLIVALLTIAKL
jgi:hypothetical protein